MTTPGFGPRDGAGALILGERYSGVNRFPSFRFGVERARAPRAERVERPLTRMP
jgi:hypothetical protein